jgi:hypothetical protein
MNDSAQFADPIPPDACVCAKIRSVQLHEQRSRWPCPHRIELLTEDQYRQLQQLGSFDLKTSSWIKTPTEIRKLGGALFCDRRYGHVFVYHNGADSYYSVRGFRGSVTI